jgi:hypothetical protein
MHIAAPNAGEIIQGFALAFRLGITHQVKNTLIRNITILLCSYCTFEPSFIGGLISLSIFR